jgi:hypothetical protein
LLLKIYHHHPFEPQFFLLLPLSRTGAVLQRVVAKMSPGVVEADVVCSEVNGLAMVLPNTEAKWAECYQLFLATAATA